MFTKNEIGRELKKQLDAGFNNYRIANWAYNFYIDNLRELTPETKDVLQYLFMMEEGPEFEFSEDELHLVAERMLKEDDKPLKGLIPSQP